MRGPVEIKFKDGIYKGKKFNSVERGNFNGPYQIVAGLKQLGLNHKNIDCYFAELRKEGSNDLIWTIHQTSNLTCQFIDLNSSETNEILRQEIIKKHEEILKGLEDLLEKNTKKSSINKELLEVIQNIVESKDVLTLYAGFDPASSEYFPVIVGWGGNFEEDSSDSRSLVAERPRTPQHQEELQPQPGYQAQLASANIIGDPRIPPNNLNVDFNKVNPFLAFLWLIIFFLILAVIYLLLISCGFYFNSECHYKEARRSQIVEQQSYVSNLSNQVLLANKLCLSEPGTKVKEKEQSPIPVPNQEIRERLDREGALKGNFEISLAWNTEVDLDLKVTCPNGASVFHSQDGLSVSEANDCGVLDIDANFKGTFTTTPVEHVKINNPADGKYVISVRSLSNSNSNKSGTITPFLVEWVDHGEVKTIEDEITPGQEKQFFYTRD